MRRASASAMARSLRIQTTAKPKSKRSSSIVSARWSICQDWAAPCEITSTTRFPSSPARSAKARPSARPSTSPAMQIWFTILVSWPAPVSPMRTQRFA